jgi:hypothetical protein
MGKNLLFCSTIRRISAEGSALFFIRSKIMKQGRKLFSCKGRYVFSKRIL